MKIVHPEWIRSLEWKDFSPAYLVIEEPGMYYSLVTELTRQIESGEGNFVCSHEEKILDMGKDSLLIRDLWNVDLNQKKLLNGVLANLKNLALEDYYIETQQILCQIGEYVQSLLDSSMEPLLWNEEMDISVLLKMVGVSLGNPEDPLERLMDYIRLAQEFLHIRLVILVGMRAFLKNDIYISFCRELASRGIFVLFLEGGQPERLLGEKMLILDEDRCEILLD